MQSTRESRSVSNATDPVIVLLMPHCEPVVANRRFGPVDWVTVAATDEDFKAALASAQRRKTAICFCKEMRSVLALRPEDCSHESSFEEFCADRYQEPLAGFDFYQEEPGEADDPRHYRVARIQTRLLDLKQKGAQTIEGLLEVRIVESKSLKMTVSTVSADLLQVTVTGEGIELVNAEVPLNRGALEPYMLMEEALRLSLKTPEDAGVILARAVEQIKQWDASMRIYPSCHVIMQQVLRRKENQRAETERVLASLYDAPVAGRFVRRELERLISGETPDRKLLAAPRSMQADLGRLRMPLDMLELTDQLAQPA